MPAYEPDLDLLLSLIEPATYAARRTSVPPWVSLRHAAAVALCWLGGARPIEIMRLRAGEWRPGKREFFIIRAEQRFNEFRARQQPILDVARDCVGAYIAAVPFELPAHEPLFRRRDGEGLVRGDIQILDRTLNRLTEGRVPAMSDLHDRFAGYVGRTRAKDGTVEGLTGRSGYWDHLDPDISRLRRALVAAHPLGRGRAGINNVPSPEVA